MRPSESVQRMGSWGHEERYLVVACLQLGQDVCHDGCMYWQGHLNLALNPVTMIHHFEKRTLWFSDVFQPEYNKSHKGRE